MAEIFMVKELQRITYIVLVMPVSTASADSAFLTKRQIRSNCTAKMTRKRLNSKLNVELTNRRQPKNFFNHPDILFRVEDYSLYVCK